MLMHILEFFEGDLRTEPAWKVKFAHLVPLHTVSTYSTYRETGEEKWYIR